MNETNNVQITRLYKTWVLKQKEDVPDYLLETILSIAENYDPINGYQNLFDRFSFVNGKMEVGKLN